jgi:hypothetical protein
VQGVNYYRTVGCTGYATQVKPSELFTPGSRRTLQPSVFIHSAELARVLHPLSVQQQAFLPIEGTYMRSLTLAAMTAAALMAGVAHADITEILNLTYASGATFDGTLVCTDDFSTVNSLTGTLVGYDGTQGTGFVGASFSESITAVSPYNFNLSPNTFFAQIYDDSYFNLLDFGYSYDSSGITLSPGGVEETPTSGLFGYNNINYGTVPYGDVLVDGSVTPTSVPEPGTLALLALGMFGLAATHRRRTLNASIG